MHTPLGRQCSHLSDVDLETNRYLLHCIVRCRDHVYYYHSYSCIWFKGYYKIPYI